MGGGGLVGKVGWLFKLTGRKQGRGQVAPAAGLKLGAELLELRQEVSCGSWKGILSGKLRFEERKHEMNGKKSYRGKVTEAAGDVVGEGLQVGEVRRVAEGRANEPHRHRWRQLGQREPGALVGWLREKEEPEQRPARAAFHSPWADQ